jgi:hypothetical protein
MRFESIILKKIKYLDIYGYIILLYFITYNTFFGWNYLPGNELEKSLDEIFKISIYIYFGFIIHIVLSYIKFKMTKYINELNSK